MGLALLLLLTGLGPWGGSTDAGWRDPTTPQVADTPSPSPPGGPVQRSRSGDLVYVFTGDIHIAADERRRGNVVCIGGDVRIEGEVTGEVVVILGSLRLIGGEVGGNMVGVLSDLEMRDARIDGGLVNVLGGFERENLRVGEQVFDLGLGGWFPGVLTLLTWLRVLGLLLVFVLLVLLVALLPERVRLLADEAPVRFVSAWFVGVLAYVGLWVVGLLVSLTVVGLPVALVAYVIFKWLGIAGLFYAIGRRIGRGLGRELSPLAGVLLVYAVYAVVLLAPSLLGWFGVPILLLVRFLFWCLFAVPGIGLILLTRAGSRAAAPPAVVPPAVPVVPPPAAAP